VNQAIAELGYRRNAAARTLREGRSRVGYDNSYLARLRSIRLTSVDSAGFDAGRLAARTLLARVADPSRAAELHLLAPTLQVRGSTAPPATD
jgi:DNA-binding LacI/PurR family transcriptional regulator